MGNIFADKLKDIENTLKNTGINNVDRNNHFYCEKCEDKGFFLNSNNEAIRCSCINKKIILKKYKDANLGKNIRNCTFENFQFKYYPKKLNEVSNSKLTYFEEAQITYDACKNFINKIINAQITKGLCICGPVGSGKTFLAASIANELLANNKQVLFAVVPDLLEELRVEYLKSADNCEEQFLNNFARKVPILILDDLGAHNYTDWTLNRLYSIINYRVNNILPIVITTNFEIHEMAAKLGERITSRILQLCQTYHLATDLDIRIKNYSQYNNIVLQRGNTNEVI